MLGDEFKLKCVLEWCVDWVLILIELWIMKRSVYAYCTRFECGLKICRVSVEGWIVNVFGLKLIALEWYVVWYLKWQYAGETFFHRKLGHVLLSSKTYFNKISVSGGPCNIHFCFFLCACSFSFLIVITARRPLKLFATICPLVFYSHIMLFHPYIPVIW